MPFRGDPVAPVFSGDDRDLLRFLGDVCMLGEAVGLSGAELIRWATYYASEDDAELWAGIPEATSEDWLVFGQRCFGYTLECLRTAATHTPT